MRKLLASIVLPLLCGATTVSAGTILDLNFDGVIADAAGHSFTTVGSPVIDTTTSAAGSGSLRINAGSANYLAFAPSADFDLGASNFTLSVAVKLADPPNFGNSLQYAGGLSQWGNAASASYQVDVELVDGTATPRFNYNDVNGQHNMVGSPLSLNIWHFVVVQRIDSIVSMFIDGGLANSFGVTGALWTPLNPLWIGEPECNGNVVCWTHPATFWLDEVRLTTDVPEPKTYALLLAGLGLVGFVAHSRRWRPTGTHQPR